MRFFAIFLFVLSMIPVPAHASFDPSLNARDQQFLQFLMNELPAEILSRDPVRIAALESKLKNYAYAERVRQRADLELAVSVDYWAAASIEPKWFIQSALAMIEGLKRAGKTTPEIVTWEGSLHRKQATIAQTESSFNTSDPANLAKLVDILQSIMRNDGKLSEIYLSLRALYTPLQLPGVFDGIPVSHQFLPGLDLARWDATMAAAEKLILQSGAGRGLPASVQGSFVKSAMDLFYTYKFPLLDMGLSEILNPVSPKPGMNPNADAAEVRNSLNSLVRVLQLVDVFQNVDLAGGGRAYVRAFQPLVEPISSLCGRFSQLSGFSAEDLRKIRESGRIVLLDPGHLGGEFADDNRDVSPAGEKGQESYGYREGHDTFLIANLAKRVLVQCAGLSEANVLLSRRGLHDEGGLFFNKAGFLLGGQPGPSLKSYDNLYFRKTIVTMARPDLLVSMHTDYSDTLTQHGLVIVPRHPAAMENGFYKSRAQYAASVNLANTLIGSLDRMMFSGAGTPSGKSANDFLHSEFKGYYPIEMDLQIFRDFREIPTVLVEGYDYASPQVRALMNSVVRGHQSGSRDVKQMRIDGADYFYHTVHQSYAEGVALGALRYLLAN